MKPRVVRHWFERHVGSMYTVCGKNTDGPTEAAVGNMVYCSMRAYAGERNVGNK